MKFTHEWLKTHLKTDRPAKEIADTLTMVGLEVEGYEDQAGLLAPFVIAEVISAHQHPDADRLRVCMVNTGTGEPVQVVCGAPNARTGMKGVFAAPGTAIPGTGIVLQKGVIRGQASNGMLCSERELMLSDNHEGIIDLPADAPVGENYAAWAGLDGVIYDIAITPNRGDCTGVYGIARDLAAAGAGDLIDIKPPRVPGTAGKTPIAIELRFSGDKNPPCRLFAGRLIRNVTNRPSPEWLQKRLRDVGLRPINALADITNFISLDRGRPLHVYDADKLSGTIHARYAKAGEKLAALDAKTYDLDETMCVIADDSGVLGLGGVMGGITTGCTDTTTSVFIESAWFDPASIARTGRKTGIVSDARYRFERFVDPEFVRPGLEQATKMVLDLCGGEACDTRVAGTMEPTETVIEFPLSEIERLTGLKVRTVEIKVILSRLGFWMSGSGDVVKIAVPSWRPDVTLKADIVEEIMRMVGVDRVPVTPLPRLFAVAPKVLTPAQTRARKVRRALAARGLAEAVTWSFISAPHAKMFGGGQRELKLANPISSDLTDMRPSLLPSLLGAAGRNARQAIRDQAIFELGQIFLSDQPAGQRNFATGLRTGLAHSEGVGRHWSRPDTPVSVYDARADLLAALSAAGVNTGNVQIVAEPAPWAHPGRGGRVQLGPKIILGWFGEVHPAVLDEFDLEGPVAAFEADLGAVPEPKPKSGRTRPPLLVSGQMPVRRDFAFVVENSVAAEKLLKAVRTVDRKLITNITLFDVYEGEHVGAGKKSIAVEVTLQPGEKTMTDAEIEAIGEKIIAAVQKATGGTLRA
ncbi:MAG: phenylalanine--tRNA ligase subunit beta [Alphaproteobacteria bacterium]|nr:phenylalanine--tRNA ligase subunit beta [Alphaproteobacteria bacterium]